MFAVCHRALFIGLCGVLLANCDEKKEHQTHVQTGQIIAHIGTEDISREELENEFRRAGIPDEMRNDDATVKRLLDELVVRKYLVKQALSAHLDHVPTVALDIQSSRDQTLANDFLQRAASKKISEIGDADIFRYIDGHPLKFAKHEFLTIEQINLPLSEYSQSVIDATKGLKSIEQADHELTALGVIHTRLVGVLNSGEIPEDLFNVLHGKKVGNVFLVRLGPQAAFFEVKNEDLRPVEGQAAVQLARQLISAEAFKAEVRNYAVAAVAGAKFEGKYAKIMQRSTAAAEPAAPDIP